MQLIEGAHGLKLAADFRGDPDSPDVVLLHGGGQTRHSWHRAAKTLVEAGYHVAAFDARGHGDSQWDSHGNYSLEAMVADLRSVLAKLKPLPVLVGASMGGLTALRAIGASAHPVARALVLVDVTPRISQDGVEQISEFMHQNMQGYESVEAAAHAVARYLPDRPRPQDASGLTQNLRLRDGRWQWHWDPMLLTTGDHAEPAVQNRLEAAARSLQVPTLLIRGANSNIVTDVEARHFLSLCPSAEYVTVSNAGHMVMGDRNDLFNSHILEFIERVRPS